MNSRILSREVLGKVMASSPIISENPIEIAKKVYQFLDETTTQTHGDYSSSRIIDIASSIGVSNKQAGRTVSDMGIGKIRHNEGFVAYWNRDQLNIIKQALNL